MKIKVISRSEEEHTRERPSDLRRVHRNPDPVLHQLAKPKEYKRALNAAKMSRMFAKPFLFSLDGHRDGVYSMARSPKSLRALWSGSCDGEIIMWDLPLRRSIWRTRAHSGFVRGLAVRPDGTSFLSCGDDQTVKLWNVSFDDIVTSDETSSRGRHVHVPQTEAAMTWLGQHAFTGIDHQASDDVFATSGEEVTLWNLKSSTPIQKYSWGADGYLGVWFNPTESNIFAATGTDRGIVLYDRRGKSELCKVSMDMRSNQVAWNPMEPFYYVVANEDSNCYTFDMRRPEKAINVHMDHVAAVLSVDFSPTGQEFVTGSYDRSVRIFNAREGRSREVYHGRRMQRIFNVKFSADARFVMSGSDDANIRVWKSEASAKLAKSVPRERRKDQYDTALMNRFKHVDSVRQILRRRQLPKAIHNARRLRGEMRDSELRKQRNVIAHSAPGSVQVRSERSKHIVEVEK